MKPKKPDRFERVVLAAMKKQDTPSSTCIWLNGPDVVKLLRQEHRAVVRMVKNSVQPYRDSDDESPACYLAVDILDQLKKRVT
jgi:hypothetical protein